MAARLALVVLGAGLPWLTVAPSRHAPTDERHFTLKARVEPERVLPGGWIDVIAELEFDSGWHATSPGSANGPRARFTCEAPDGFEPVGDVLVEAPTPHEDPQLGKVEWLEGRVELRRRYAVPARTSGSSSHAVKIDLSLTVCDAFRCLPRLSVGAEASLAIDSSNGRIAPAPARTTPIAPLDERERRLLGEMGYLVRARQEGACSPGEAAFVLLEFLLEPETTLRVRTVEPQRNAPDPEIVERTRGFERLPLCLPVESRDGEATLDHGVRAYQVFRTSPGLDPGHHEIPYSVTVAPNRADVWVEQRLSVPLVLSERR